MLIQTLKRLEGAGLVAGMSSSEVPPRADYALTELGWSLRPPVEALVHWVAKHALTIVAGTDTLDANQGRDANGRFQGSCRRE